MQPFVYRGCSDELLGFSVPVFDVLEGNRACVNVTYCNVIATAVRSYPACLDVCSGFCWGAS